MNDRISRSLGAALALLITLVSFGCAQSDPLPSWNDASAKRAIVAFVEQATDATSDGYIAPDERIATFDNDGTLWPEQPLVQGLFLHDRVVAMAQRDPSLRTKQPYKAALEGDEAALKSQGEKAILELVAATHADMAQEDFDRLLDSYFAHAQYSALGVGATDIAYQPMVELMDYLRANGFDVYICSGGGVDFIRAVSQRMYGVPRQNVIGSTLVYEQRDVNGRSTLWRTDKLGVFNDQGAKPVDIYERIGRRPAFAGGNVRSGGDVEMLRYAQGREGPSFQLLVNHDDPAREFAYTEKDNASLNAARRNGWVVVSMKNDWKRVFASDAHPQSSADARR